MATTQESFEAMLSWLDADREVAGQKYETVRRGLIRIFVSKGYSDAEDLADETFDRVMRRLPDIQDTYEGEPEKYFIGVTRFIIKERDRRKEIATDVFPETLRQAVVPSDEYTCLLNCLDLLPQTKRALILDYHVYVGHDKIEYHREMASELAISENALRVRACHVRKKLHKCVKQCTRNLSGKQNTAAGA